MVSSSNKIIFPDYKNQQYFSNNKKEVLPDYDASKKELSESMAQSSNGDQKTIYKGLFDSKIKKSAVIDLSKEYNDKILEIDNE